MAPEGGDAHGSPPTGPARLDGRRLWIDAQLPPALAGWLAATFGVDATHVDALGLLAADDRVIHAAAREAGATVVLTKDDDFVQLLDRHGPPPQVIWLTCGNVRNAELRVLVLSAWPRIAALVARGEPLVELSRRV